MAKGTQDQLIKSFFYLLHVRSVEMVRSWCTFDAINACGSIGKKVGFYLLSSMAFILTMMNSTNATWHLSHTYITYYIHTHIFSQIFPSCHPYKENCTPAFTFISLATEKQLSNPAKVFRSYF